MLLPRNDLTLYNVYEMDGFLAVEGPSSFVVEGFHSLRRREWQSVMYTEKRLQR